jgi:CubicO group peptidase (beta-lactamase class C family)
MTHAEATTGVHGTFDDAFAGVAAEFRRNFTERGELGASLVVMIDGDAVVDLWGGQTARRDGNPWEPDTLATVFSCTKAATAVCLHLLADRGEIDLDAPLADIWPELTAARQGATVRMALDHSLGLPAIREPLEPGTCCDWDAMIGALERTEPWWRPGTMNGYHMLTYGWTVGEIVRRVSGVGLGEFFRTQIAEPVGADFHIGLPADQHHRMARISPWRPEPGWVSAFTDAIVADRDGLAANALLNSGGFNANDPNVWSAEIGAAGGVASARGLAAFYRPLGVPDEQVLSNDAIIVMSEVAGASAIDATLQIRTRFGLGPMRSMDNRGAAAGRQESVIMGRHAFGHVGAGGSIGFADPECGLAFGYVMNQQGPGLLLNERGQSLIDATYRAIGYRTNDPGCWVR